MPTIVNPHPTQNSSPVGGADTDNIRLALSKAQITLSDLLDDPNAPYATARKRHQNRQLRRKLRQNGPNFYADKLADKLGPKNYISTASFRYRFI